MEPVYDIPQVLFPSNTPGRLPSLSPPFLNPDDAARFAHQLIGDKRAAQYAGVILKNAQCRYLASRPVKVTGERFSPTQFIAVDEKGQLKHPHGFTCYGFYYSRAHQLGGGETAPAGVSRADVITLANFFYPAIYTACWVWPALLMCITCPVSMARCSKFKRGPQKTPKNSSLFCRWSRKEANG